jgi:hypothetical protein
MQVAAPQNNSSHNTAGKGRKESMIHYYSIKQTVDENAI